MFGKYYRISRGATLTNSQVINQVSKIAQTYGKFYSKGEVIKKSEQDREVEIYLYQDPSKSHLPIEIYVIFDAFIYFEERSLPYEISTISCYFKESSFIEGNIDKHITIYREDFLSLYNSIEFGTNNHDTINALADQWIEQNFYYRYALELKPEREYTKLLLTKWRKSLYSNNKNFNMMYDFEADSKMSTMAFQGQTGKFMNSIFINETGYLYGAWDEEDNIWIYGETSGIQVIKLNENEEWAIKKSIDVSEMPYPLKMVVEYYESE